MDFAPLPATAAWRHRDARDGFEVAYFQVLDRGCRIEGLTTAIEDGVTWAVEYFIDLDETGATRRRADPRPVGRRVLLGPARGGRSGALAGRRRPGAAP